MSYQFFYLFKRFNIPVIINNYLFLDILFNQICLIQNSFAVNCKLIIVKLKSFKIINTVMFKAACRRFLLFNQNIFLADIIKDIFKFKWEQLV